MSYNYQTVPLKNPAEVSARARELVSQIALSLDFTPDTAISVTLAAAAVQWSLFQVFVINGLTQDEAETACALAVHSLDNFGIWKTERPEGQA